MHPSNIPTGDIHEVLCEECHIILTAESEDAAQKYMFIHMAAAHSSIFKSVVKEFDPEEAIVYTLAGLMENRCPDSLACLA